MKTPNQKTMAVKLRRIDVCDLLIACNWAGRDTGDCGGKWRRLHDTLREQLDEFDSKEANK